MIFNIVEYKDEKEWLSLRTKGVGGSDASACLDANPYKSKRDLYLEKKGLKEKVEISNNKLVEYGKKAENPIRELFKLDYPELSVFHRDVLLVRKDKDYIRGSLDGFIYVNEDISITSYWKAPFKSDETFDIKCVKHLKKGMQGVLEIKTSEVLNSMHKEKWNNQVPQNYYIQVVHYLNVTGFDFVILRVKLVFEDKNKIRTHEMRDYVFLRDEILEDLSVEESAIDEFWNDYYLADIEPPLTLM